MLNKQILIYTSQNCSYCRKAEALLKEKNLEFERIDVTDNQKLRAELIEKAGGRKTVPQIFIDDTHIGGFDDLKALEDSGKLNELLI